MERLHPSVVLLDIMLPGLNGHEVCRRMRQASATQDIPIIMISALGSEEDRISGLEMGADDYMVKPFSPREVVSRVGTVLRRRREWSVSSSSNSDCVLAIEDHCLIVSLRGKRLTVSQDEWELLRYLTSGSGQIVTVEELVSVIWGDREPIRDRQVRTLMQSLKTKLENSFSGSIEILSTIGYRSVTPMP